MGRARIILHLGAPKTGSTYLQRRLAANRERLRQRGVFWPILEEVGAMAGNAKLLASALAGAPSASFARVFPEIEVARLDPELIAGRLLEDWRSDAEVLVLSAENLRPGHAQRLRECLPHSADILPVLFVRRQDHWANSYFNQLTKTADVAEEVSDFVARICHTADERFCRPDWLEHFSAWEAAFGACQVLFYDEARERLFDAFMAAVGQDGEGLADIAPVQESIDVFQLAYLVTSPRPILDSEFLLRREAAARVSTRRNFGSRRPSVLDSADLERLRDRFETANRLLLERLGRDPGDRMLALETRADFSFADFLAGAEFVDFRREADDSLALARSADPQPGA